MFNIWVLCSRQSYFRRGGRRSRRGRSWYTRRPVPTREQLDQDIDDYMSATRSRLDAELDVYMASETAVQS